MNVVRAEAIKALTLPAARWLAMTLVGLAALVPPLMATEAGSGASLIELLLRVLHVPALALGCVLAAQELDGDQLRTSLCAVPRRWPVLLTQGSVVLSFATVVGAATTGLLTAWLHEPADGSRDPQVVGGTAYVILIVLLGWAATLAARALVPALAGLGTLLVLTPVLQRTVEAAGHLPGAAGTSLLRGEWVAGDVAWLGLWVGLAIAGAALSLIRRDA